MELLGVPVETIAQHGAVSARTAAAMARGAVVRAGVDLAVSIIGVAGPGGGSRKTDRPRLCRRGDARRRQPGRAPHFPGDRGDIRQAALVEALEMLQAEAKPG
jgi:PncC family amidohydrolase